MSKLPSKVNIFTHNVSIDYLSESEDKELEGKHGYYHHYKLKIVIDSDLAPDLQKSTLLHEIMHACLSIGNVPVYPENIGAAISEDDWNHRAIYTLENSLMYVIKNNKEIIDYLRS